MTRPSSEELNGRVFVGVFSSADASGLSEPNSRFTLYLPGDTNAITLASTDQVVITSVDISSTGAVIVTLYDGADNSPGAGEQILKLEFAAKGVYHGHYVHPHACAVGTYPKVKASGAGQVEVTIRGVISR